MDTSRQQADVQASRAHSGEHLNKLIEQEARIERKLQALNQAMASAEHSGRPIQISIHHEYHGAPGAAAHSRTADPRTPGASGLARCVIGACVIASAVGFGWMAANLSNANEEAMAHPAQDRYGGDEADGIGDRWDRSTQRAPQGVPDLSLKDVSTRLKYVDIRYGGSTYRTLDAQSRILLSKAAANEARLDEVGLDWRYIYGVINAETHWIDRAGMGKNGVKSLGLAQFEPVTAKHYGLNNPLDPIQSIAASARLIKDAAQWSARKVDEFKFQADERERAFKEGISVFYNTSWKIRKRWSPQESHTLPAATKTHITNVEAGKMVGLELERMLQQGVDVKSPTLQMQMQARKQAEENNRHLHDVSISRTTRIVKEAAKEDAGAALQSAQPQAQDARTRAAELASRALNTLGLGYLQLQKQRPSASLKA